MKNIRIVVSGPRGKMSREVLHMISTVEHFELVGVIDYKNINSDDYQGAKVFTDAEECFSKLQPDVYVDFTNPEVGLEILEQAIRYGVRPVVGTSGFNTENIKQFVKASKEARLGGVIAPNFTVGGVLMMKFAAMAAKYFEDIEIIEMHHDQKLDAPSGTAVKTAEMISLERAQKSQGHPDEKELIEGARGADYNGMKIHSVRLPGLVAHQQVLLGSQGELLTIRHDSLNRNSFMSGVKISIETVMKLDELVYGLENILD